MAGAVRIELTSAVLETAVLAFERHPNVLAGSEGFEPPEGFPSPVFKTGAINRALPTAQISERN